MNHHLFFENPIKKKKIRNGVFAYQFSNGCVNIEGKKYFGYSLTESIKLFRQSTKN